jgi:hypothetical protein
MATNNSEKETKNLKPPAVQNPRTSAGFTPDYRRETKGRQSFFKDILPSSFREYLLAHSPTNKFSSIKNTDKSLEYFQIIVLQTHKTTAKTSTWSLLGFGSADGKSTEVAIHK